MTALEGTRFAFPKAVSVVYTDGNGEPHIFRTMAHSLGEATLTAQELIGPGNKTVRSYLDADWE